MKLINTLLPLNLQFFAEEGTDSSDETQNTDSAQQNEHMIPKSRFDEVNQKYKELQTTVNKLASDKEEADRKAKEEAGEYKTLYESTNKEYGDFKSQFESLQGRNKELEGVINTLLDTKLQSVPEDYHELIPEHLTPEAKLAWIDKAEAKGLFGKVVQEPVGKQTNGSSGNQTITKEQFNSMDYFEKTKLFKDNPELYTKLRD